jgi:hypothetical protein
MFQPSVLSRIKKTYNKIFKKSSNLIGFLSIPLLIGVLTPSSFLGFNLNSEEIPETQKLGLAEVFVKTFKNTSNSPYDSASVMPFYKNNNGEGFFLIGNDQHTGNLWGDFGGRKERQDKSSMETAVREFTEESLGLIDQVASNILNNLEKTFKFENRKKDHVHVIYISSLNGVAEIEDIRKAFIKKRFPPSKLRYNQREKSDIAWLSTSELVNVISNNDEKELKNCSFRVYEKPFKSAPFKIVKLRPCLIEWTILKLFQQIGAKDPRFIEDGMQSQYGKEIAL